MHFYVLAAIFNLCQLLNDPVERSDSVCKAATENFFLILYKSRDNGQLV